MADNPYVNKVEYAGQTIVDLTGDTVQPTDVMNGVTFHDRSGAPRTGNMITHDVYDGLDSTSTDDALSANQGKVLKDKIESSSLTILSSNNLTCSYLIRGGFCYIHVNGTPSTTSNITFTVPKALIASHNTVPQWGQTSNVMQVWIDANSTTLTIRNHVTKSVNVTFCYPVNLI